jgi:hypothetical protein
MSQLVYFLACTLSVNFAGRLQVLCVGSFQARINKFAGLHRSDLYPMLIYLHLFFY